MKLVLDTNVVVSGLLWKGPAHQLLTIAMRDKYSLFSSPALLAELQDVLNREKFFGQLKSANISVKELVLGYAALSQVIKPDSIIPIVFEDPDDDMVLACALAAKVDYIISGDSHLKSLKNMKIY